MTVWVCGNSQSRALSKGLSAMSDVGSDVSAFVLGHAKYELTDYSGIHNGVVTVTVEEYAKNLESSTGKPYFDKSHTWGFCQGTHNARIFRDEFWNNCDPSEVAVRQRRPISLAILDAIIEADQKYIKLFHRRLTETGTRCFVISCPPPRGDHPCVQSGTRLETIAYIDQRARTLMKNHLVGLGVPFIDCPPEAATPEGLLKPEFYAPDRPGVKDAHHANPDYGLMMMHRVLDYLSSSKRNLAVDARVKHAIAVELSAA
jgi:hypothetical protein